MSTLSAQDLQDLSDNQVYCWCLEHWYPSLPGGVELLARLTEQQIRQVHRAFFARFRYKPKPKT